MKPDWNAIRAEYIGGGISQRKLADKYGISVGILLRRANQEHWADSRNKANNRAIMLAEQKIATAASENAAIAQRIKAKLLKKLEKEIDALPDLMGSETRQTVLENEYLTNDKGKPIGQKPKKAKEATKAYKLRDLTAAYNFVRFLFTEYLSVIHSSAT